jgi:hypothetical protein
MSDAVGTRRDPLEIVAGQRSKRHWTVLAEASGDPFCAELHTGRAAGSQSRLRSRTQE